ncbi:transcription factor grauzone-like [Uranotaenia lowii]|uniref:transcription factor grauzone-like n=1 Tax=Uranotaenia lowii TaxID=190385 RepID=UPI00247AB9C2|nr:transcription factor grauzone-like [Uranotaenia lowii]
METVQQSCRLCLDPEVTDPCSIESSPLNQKLALVFTFTFSTMDQMPKGICQPCCSIVDNFYQFSEKVQTNQDYLRMLVGEQPDEKHDLIPTKMEQTEALSHILVKMEPTETVLEETIIADEEQIVDQSCDAPDDDNYRQSSSDSTGDDDDDDDDSDDEFLADKIPKRKSKSSVADQEPRVKRKYTRRAPLRGKVTKEKKRPGLDPSKEYRNKSRETIEEEDRKILEYFKFVCELCHEQSETFIDLRRHFRDRHDQKGYQRCCNKKLFKRCHLLEHIQVHLNPNIYGCDACTKSFSSKEYLQLHKMQAHETIVERPYKCDKCPKSFVQKGQLSSHMGRHQLYPCTKCDKVLAGKGSLSAHMVNMHSDEGRMICDTCGREFKTKPCFDKHVRKHLGILEDTSIECEICGDILHNKATMKKHMIAKHIESTEEHICNLCGKNAPNKFALESHKRKVHCAEKYQCEFCEKKFKNPVTLKEHRASHTGEVLYTCPFCATTSNSKANMYAHKKKSHPIEWAQEKQNKLAEQRELKKGGGGF